MAVLIGGASINEFGQKEGGKPGDQNKKEVYIQDWYLHSKGWVIIRAKNVRVRAKMADDMKWACQNDMIGYSFWEHCYTLYDEVKKYGFDCSKVKIPCETNCAKLVRICALYAGVKVDDFYTGDEVAAFARTGQFEIITDPELCSTDSFLRRGDILCTCTTGHTCIVLSDGDKVDLGVPYRIVDCAYCNLRSEPNINGKVLEVLQNGTMVGLQGWADTGWGKVRHGQWEGYVSPKYLRELDTATASGDVWLRETPGTSGKKIEVIPKGASVHITGITEMVGKTVWYETIFKSHMGFASGKYIRPIKLK